LELLKNIERNLNKIKKISIFQFARRNSGHIGEELKDMFTEF
jgi:hypothetical protein